MRAYLADVRYGFTALDAEPANEGVRTEQFRLKRLTIKTLIERANINKDRKPEDIIRLNV